MIDPRLLIAAGALSISFAAGFWLNGAIKGREIAKIELAHAQAVLEASNNYANLQEEARNTEADLRTIANALNVELVEAQRNAQIDLDSLRESIRLHNVRLSVPIKHTYCPGGPAENGTATGNDSQGRAELSQESAEFLTSQAHRADEAALMLNSCMDQYEAVRKELSDYAQSID